MIHIGIDPGSQGAMAAVTQGGQIAWCRAFPHQNGKCTPHGIYDLLGGFLNSVNRNKCDVHVWLEKVQAPMIGKKQLGSSTSTFNFGKAFGWAEMAVIAHGLGYTLVHPRMWQRRMWQGTDGSLENKARSIQAAKRIWPSVDFRKSERARNPHDGITEACLIGLYGKQKWKGE